MKVATQYANFAHAKLDHDLMGRYDLPLYNQGADVFENFISNFKGNAIYSSGFLNRLAFQDCAFVEFKFGNTQNYLCVFYNTKIRFLAFDGSGNFGWVLSGGVPLEVSTPYSLAESKQLCFTQNNDVMVVTHPTYAPYKLTRTGAAAFTFATFSRTADPFTGAGSYPALCLFYKGRLFYAATNNKITTVWMSVAGSYDDFTIASPLTDASAFSFTVADISQRILWLFAGDNSLIAGSTDGIVAINGGSVNTAITAATVQANITTAEPTNGAYPVKKDGKIFYVGRNNRNMYYMSYDILTESFLSKDANISSYDITKGGLSKIRYKKDRNDLIFSLRGDGGLCSLNYSGPENQNVIGWHERETAGSFHDIAVMGDNNGDQQFFTLTVRNGTYYIEQQMPYVEFAKRSDFFTTPIDETRAAEDDAKAIDDEAYIRFVSEQLRQCNYLDGSLTYSDLRTSTITYDPSTGVISSTAGDFNSGDVGKHIAYKTATGYESGRFQITKYRNSTQVEVTILQTPQYGDGTALVAWSSWYKSFTTVSGLTQYIGEVVGVVSDGGYLNDFTIAGDTLTLAAQTCSIVIGQRYTGTIKTMCLGFQFQGVNTQATLKNIVRVSARTMASAGGKIGSSPYDLQPIQELSQSDINYMPPMVLDGTKDVDYTDDAEEDKFLWIVQDQPLPFTICNMMMEANYAGSQ